MRKQFMTLLTVVVYYVSFWLMAGLLINYLNFVISIRHFSRKDRVVVWRALVNNFDSGVLIVNHGENFSSIELWWIYWKDVTENGLQYHIVTLEGALAVNALPIWGRVSFLAKRYPEIQAVNRYVHRACIEDE